MKTLVKNSPHVGDVKKILNMERISNTDLALLPTILLSQSKCLNELFLSLLPDINLNKLDDNDLELLKVFTEGYLLNDKKLLLTLPPLVVLAHIKKLGGENLHDAVEGLGLLARNNNVKTLDDLDLLLTKETLSVLKNLPFLPLLQEDDQELLLPKMNGDA
ncbi:MAG: hypothetical protein AAFZ15_11795 [Bacteroidota bacterium]